jgi:hypothetical protein
LVSDSSAFVGYAPGELTPGRWESTGGFHCSWGRFDANGDVIESGNGPEPTATVLLDSDAWFESRGCDMWRLVE